MEQVEHFGIVFRNASHFLWLLQSMFILVVTLIFAVDKALRKRAISWGFWCAGTFHGSTAIEALFITKAGTRVTRLYSPDCIWFNALMVGVYVLLWLVFLALPKLKPANPLENHT